MFVSQQTIFEGTVRISHVQVQSNGLAKATLDESFHVLLPEVSYTERKGNVDIC